MTPADYIAKAALSAAQLLLRAEDTEGACNRGLRHARRRTCRFDRRRPRNTPQRRSKRITP
jgi:hypothetical protein